MHTLKSQNLHMFFSQVPVDVIPIHVGMESAQSTGLGILASVMRATQGSTAKQVHMLQYVRCNSGMLGPVHTNVTSLV
jgi:hypothetical protein